MIIGISGLYVDNEGNKRASGAGKDTVADILFVRRHVVKVALADPLKRICQDVYGFTYEQLWGASELRNVPDLRYVRIKAGSLVRKNNSVDGSGGEPNPPTDIFLTPRFALQQLGTEWARACYANTWVDYGVKVAKQLMDNQSGKIYLDHRGVIDRDWVPDDLDTEKELEAHEEETASYPEEVHHVAFSDVRFFNEFDAIHANGGKVIRVLRKYDGVFDDAMDASHRSERELSNSDDEDFDYVVANDGSLHDLKLNTLRMFDVLTGRILPFDESQQDVPPFKRQ